MSAPDAKVDELHNTKLAQGPPVIESAISAVGFDIGYVSNGTGFHEHAAFVGDYAAELPPLKEMEAIVDQGRRFQSMLYAYRSVSKALPMVPSDLDDGTKQQVYRQVFDLLRPEIAKLREFMDFHERAIKVFTRHMKALQDPIRNKRVVSEGHVNYLIRLIDMLVALDSLKDMKACLLNDFARYKRAFSFIRSALPDSDFVAEEIHALQMFLGNPAHPHNIILFNLRDDIQKIITYEDIVLAIMELCARRIREGHYITEKHSLLRVLLHCFYLADSPDERGFNVFKNKKVPISQYRELFRALPVLPLFADMQISVRFVLERCHNWRRGDSGMEREWIQEKEAKVEVGYALVTHQDKIREDYMKFTARFASLTNDIKGHLKSENPFPRPLVSAVFEAAIAGMQLLADWKAHVLEQLAWKYSHPVTHDRFVEMGGAAASVTAEYEKVLLYNLSAEDKYALVEIIGMIKGLASLMLEAEAFVAPYIRRSIHDDLQTFVQLELARPLRKAHKRARKEVFVCMQQMRQIAADWAEGKDQSEDYKQKKKELIAIERDYPPRNVAPTLTQIYLIRRMMHTVFSEDAKGMKGGMFAEKDLKPEWISEWQTFYSKSFYYEYLLDYRRICSGLADMGNLWYREFYLELTKQIQFPISMSLPWILTEFVMNTSSLTSSICFPFDIYNDAAERALSELDQQFLFDEVEAELNLSFDQLVFGLSRKIFVYYKSSAAQLTMDKGFKETMEYVNRLRGEAGAGGGAADSAFSSLEVTNVRFESAMAQRHIQLLGRSVDLQQLLSEHINAEFRKNVEFIIGKFESQDLTSVIELESLLNVCRLSHELLVDHLNLDPWDDLFREVNEDTTVGAFRGRVLVHTFSELSNDFFRNFVFNTSTGRFVRAPETFLESPVEREKPRKGVEGFYWFGSRFNKAMDTSLRLTRGYFGKEHFQAIIRLLSGHGGLPLLVDELTSYVETQTVYTFQPYGSALLSALDKKLKLPSAKYGVVGAYGFFDLKLKPIAKYEALGWGVFQTLREIGNALAFVLLLDEFIAMDSVFQNQVDAFFLQEQPADLPPVVQVAPNAQDPVSAVLQAALGKLPKATPELGGIPAAVASVQNALDRGGSHRSIFARCLQRLQASLTENKVDVEWQGNVTTGGIHMENPKDFSRLWSCMQFVFLSQTQRMLDGEQATFMANFGDSVAWAGCTIMHLLGQRQRFELLDFAYYIHRLQSQYPVDLSVVDRKKKKKDKMPQTEAMMLPFLRALLDGVDWARRVNNEVFSLLSTYIEAPNPPPVEFSPHQGQKGATGTVAAGPGAAAGGGPSASGDFAAGPRASLSASRHSPSSSVSMSSSSMAGPPPGASTPSASSSGPPGPPAGGPPAGPPPS